MYFPYLYGRQAELDAVRDQASDLGAPQQIVPIIEPALKPGGQLTRNVSKLVGTLAELGAHGCSAYVITNPSVGGLADPAVAAAWTSAMSVPLSDPTTVRPAFKVDLHTTAADLAAFVAAYAGRTLAVVVADDRALGAAAIAAAMGTTPATYFLLPRADSVAFITQFGTSDIVRIMDNFPHQPRNADYSGTALLANNHHTFPTASPAGFGDFTVLPNTISFTGGRTGAAVIHLSYEDPASGDFWVEHFVSDEKSVNVGSFQSKLLEALAHLHADATAYPGKFTSSPALADYDRQRTTGNVTSPGGNKRLQIRHHLHLVARHLGI